jgi:hypothetical protein
LKKVLGIAPANKTPPARRRAPGWLQRLIADGYIPYVATSERLLPSFNTSPFGDKARCYLMENQGDAAFFESYLLSNSLGFKSPDLKMPHWVLIDCTLMQTAIVGFMKARDELPAKFLDYYRNDPRIDMENLTHIPISGQIASLTADGKSLFGFSLFSLGSSINGPKNIGLFTKALALEVYRAADYDELYGITQYDNPAIKIHGRFSSRMEIHQPIVPLHPKKDMTLIYKTKVDYDPWRLEENRVPVEPGFWIQAHDRNTKLHMQKGIAKGKRYVIVPPFSVQRDGEVWLPVIEENAQ